MVRIRDDERNVIEVLEDALAEARKNPKHAVCVVMLEDKPEGWDIWTMRAGKLLYCLALAARLLHRVQQTIDES